jgi:hypothetical protein
VQNKINYRMAPYSLGKLIDWKRFSVSNIIKESGTPYSLGKLIDWKPERLTTELTIKEFSLLVREIN